MDQKTRRDAGLAFLVDDALHEERIACRRLLQAINTADWGDYEVIGALALRLFGKADGPVSIRPPFFCDYGHHIEVGKNFYANVNCTIVDAARVRIGDNCLLGPNVSLYTAGHPIHPFSRNSGFEYAKEIVIGDNVWIGGSSVVCPGVHIGSNVVIGAGSVVTKDVPDWTVAVGNPCRVLRRITDEDKRLLFRHERIDDEAWEQILAMLAE